MPTTPTASSTMGSAALSPATATNPACATTATSVPVARAGTLAAPETPALRSKCSVNFSYVSDHYEKENHGFRRHAGYLEGLVLMRHNAAFAQAGMTTATPSPGATSSFGMVPGESVGPNGLPLGVSPGVSTIPNGLTGTITVPGASSWRGMLDGRDFAGRNVRIPYDI